MRILGRRKSPAKRASSIANLEAARAAGKTGGWPKGVPRKLVRFCTCNPRDVGHRITGMAVIVNGRTVVCDDMTAVQRDDGYLCTFRFVPLYAGFVMLKDPIDFASLPLTELPKKS